MKVKEIMTSDVVTVLEDTFTVERRRVADPPSPARTFRW